MRSMRQRVLALAASTLMFGSLLATLPPSSAAKEPCYRQGSCSGRVSKSEWRFWDGIKGKGVAQFHYWYMQASGMESACTSLKGAGDPQPSTNNFKQSMNAWASLMLGLHDQMLGVHTWANRLVSRAGRYRGSARSQVVDSAHKIAGGAGLFGLAFTDLRIVYLNLSGLSCDQSGELADAEQEFHSAYPMINHGFSELYGVVF
jgi:hypothetical protein